jgi:hypothetical protein
MSQLGRIGGQVLTDNLLRAGVDLAFETELLYLKVNTRQIGIRQDAPVYDLDVTETINTTNLEVTTQLSAGNLQITAPNTFSTSVGGIAVRIAGSTLFHDKLITQVSGNPRLQLDGNAITSFSNQNIVLDPNGSGTVELRASTDIIGDLAVSGNINIGGNLSKQGSIFLGDDRFDGEGSLPENDTITINTDFAQSLIPGEDLTYNLGIDRADSTPRQWAQAHISDWTNISTGAWPGSGLRSNVTTVSNQLTINGNINKISAIQSNEDVFLNPNSGITYVEQLKWQAGNIENLLDTPLTLVSGGIGYVQFTGTNGMVIPAGTDAQRRLDPEVGETRWNTTVPLDQYLECYDGNAWVLSTGGGEIVTQRLMEDLGFIYSVVLG